ncbi:hypothetical protein JW964_12455 [candidate division KSB1 bacterium]|nr:hypothetical protein [candidate division KSB1 bacterium]
MKNLMKHLVFLIGNTIAITAILSCSKSSKYELDSFLRVPDSTQTAFITNQSWQSQIDLKTDGALFQSLTDSQMFESWRKNGYQIQFQFDPIQISRSNIDHNIFQREKLITIISINGNEQNFFNSESTSFLKFIHPSTIQGVQGKFYLNLFNPDPVHNSMFQFNIAFSKGSYFKNLLRFSHKPLWFNIELPSNENFNWPDLWTAYQQTMVALLMHPEVTGFHFQTIPNSSNKAEPISSNTDINRNLIARIALFNHILHSLNRFKPDDYTWFSAINYIGELVSQSIYLQSDLTPHQKSEDLAADLLNCGIPAERLILERCGEKNYLNGYRILFLDYPQIAPLNPEIHENLAHWVRTGGILILSGENQSGEMRLPEWLKKMSFTTPIEHLLHCLEIPRMPVDKSYAAGKGTIIFRRELLTPMANKPTHQLRAGSLLEEAVRYIQDEHYFFKPQNYLCLYRGPLILAAVMSASENKKMLEIPGTCIDCLSPSYSLIDAKVIMPGEVALLFNLKKFRTKTNEVILSNSKIANQKLNSPEFSFDSHGPSGVECHTFIKLILMPRVIVIKSQEEVIQYQMEWYPQEKLLRLVYPMQINGVQIKLSW